MRHLSVVLLAVTGLLATALATGVTSGPATAAAGSGSVRILETRVIGHTAQGRPIAAYRVGQPGAKRKVVFMGAIHGNETGPSRILQNLLRGRLIRGADVWLIPWFNRDGVAHHRRKNARGVDLNRNFPYHWKRQGGAYSSGSGPASEPETRALMAFMRQIRPTYVVSFHQPLHGVGLDRKSGAFTKRLARNLKLPRKAFNCNSGCHGTFTEWFNHTLPGVAITVEYGRGVSKRQRNVTGPRGLLLSVGARR